MRLRLDLEKRRKLFVPDKYVIMDTDDYFSYQRPNGPVVGWNRNEEIWWRNRKFTEEEVKN